jgi:V-type H+-transporting ATPase subunit a
MQLVQLFIQAEAAHDTLDELGRLGLIQFRDLNPHQNPFQRAFISEVKRTDELERKLSFFKDQIDKANEKIQKEKLNIPLIKIQEGDEPLVDLSLDELEGKFEEYERELQQFNSNQENLYRSYNELVEYRHVIKKANKFFVDVSDVRAQMAQEQPTEPLVRDKGEEGKSSGAETVSSAYAGVKLGYVTGVVLRDKFASFERIMFRATRGNLYLRYAEVKKLLKDADGKDVAKNVFIIFFQGERLQTKIKKLCETFGATLYHVPEGAAERKELSDQIQSKLDDLKVVLSRTEEHRRQSLANLALHLFSWQQKVKKEKAIYHTMNMFSYNLGKKCLVAEGWVPKSATEDVQRALRVASERSGALVPSVLTVVKSTEEPPTYFRTNKFTKVFQDIVDAYGVARYQEANPAVFTAITFPFLFGVMFGDVGHGALLLGFTLVLIANEKRLQHRKLNEMVDILFKGRYLLLLMSLFSIYMGFLYNELFSVPMDIFGSSYYLDLNDPGLHYLPIIDKNGVFHPYPFGVDPVWKNAENELNYYNSLKMKMSVLIGVAQMVLGIFMKLLNGIHFRKPEDVLFEFLPQIIFMLSIFGYLCFIIIYKWFIPYYMNDQMTKGLPPNPGPCANITVPVNVTCIPPGTQCAPRLLNVLIYMFLAPTDPCQSKDLFPDQLNVQLALVVLAIVSIPTMLVFKPLVLRWRAKRQLQYQLVQDSDDVAHKSNELETASEASNESSGQQKGKRPAPRESSTHGEKFEFGEVMIHQLIETIEFVLGAVSNTASYLRLWALSLAHSELATVFWNMVLMLSIEQSLFVIGIVGMTIWFGATLGVLMVMESLSAFLHALRLQWVEYQNKFYSGDGKPFLPFSYQRILSGEDEEM